jgi:OmpA family
MVYSNWELSGDRANQARRVMESSGMRPNQVAQIRGYADQDLRNKDNPKDPSNPTSMFKKVGLWRSPYLYYITAIHGIQ